MTGGGLPSINCRLGLGLASETLHLLCIRREHHINQGFFSRIGRQIQQALGQHGVSLSNTSAPGVANSDLGSPVCLLSLSHQSIFYVIYRLSVYQSIIYVIYVH